ncbi:A disintegrin and metalloproteinase with thrombospondin motifs 12-like [Littorina saxatilis]|uniref:Peptidase M12B domain-containing protein n=1 Tax=Littorina saxatilis TaxID=31220 RepID=A0AAN9ARX3_9CAEN
MCRMTNLGHSTFRALSMLTMTRERSISHVRPLLLLFPFLIGSCLLLTARCAADKSAENASRRFDIVSRLDEDARGNRDNDVVYIERRSDDNDEELAGLLHRARRQLATTQNEVELLIVLDDRAFQRFLGRNNNNDAAARTEVERYFAGIVKSVNERLAKFDAQTFSVRAILTKIVILTSAESGVTDNLDGNNDGIINADQALNNFNTLGISLEPVNPHDYTLLITGYDLRRASGANSVGITYQTGVCSQNKQGVMEEQGDEMISVTMAHEIGHTLGAVHDQQQNQCPDQFFVMGPASGAPDTRALAPNPWAFSSCSQTEMRIFLSSGFTNCLRSRQTTPGTELDLAALTVVPLGQQYNADRQCRQAFGPGSVFCRARYNDPVNFNFGDMCYKMWCSEPGINICRGTLPFFGTSCGDRRWCDQGRCVVAATAPPAVSPTCPQGDDPTANCSPASCLVEPLRCCRTCQPDPVLPLSVFGVQPTTPLLPTPDPNTPDRPATGSIFGVEPGTTPGPGPAPGVSIFGVQPGTATPGPIGPTLSIDGVTPVPTGPTAPPGPTTTPGVQVSVAGPAAATTTQGPTVSVPAAIPAGGGEA